MSTQTYARDNGDKQKDEWEMKQCVLAKPGNRVCFYFNEEKRREKIDTALVNGAGTSEA